MQCIDAAYSYRRCTQHGLCVWNTIELCKNGLLIEMPFGGLKRKHVLDGGPDPP